MSVVEYKVTKPETGQEKWNPVDYQYCVVDDSTDFKGISLSVWPDGSKDVVVSFDGNQADNALELLKCAGFKDKDIDFEMGNLKIENVDDEGLLRVLAALSNDVDFDHGKTVFAVIDKDIAHNIAMGELERLKLDVIQTYAGNLYGYKYVDVNFEDTALEGVSCVRHIQENAQFHEAGPDYFVDIFLDDWRRTGEIKDALAKADIAVEEFSKDKALKASADVSAVTAALADAGILPKYLKEVVVDKVQEARPQGVKAPGMDCSM